MLRQGVPIDHVQRFLYHHPIRTTQLDAKTAEREVYETDARTSPAAYSADAVRISEWRPGRRPNRRPLPLLALDRKHLRGGQPRKTTLLVFLCTPSEALTAYVALAEFSPGLPHPTVQSSPGIELNLALLRVLPDGIRGRKAPYDTRQTRPLHSRVAVPSVCIREPKCRRTCDCAQGYR